jgi:hypothetical protein
MGERRVMQEGCSTASVLSGMSPMIICCARSTGSLDLSEVRAHLGPYYSDIGRPSIDPELMMRMLIVGYCLGIRSERRLCDEVISIWPIAGFVDWGSMAMSQIIRRSPRTATVVFARAICCASYSRRWGDAA